MTAELALKAVENACLNVKNTDGISFTVTLEHNIQAIYLKAILKNIKSNIHLVEKDVLMITLALNHFIHY